MEYIMENLDNTHLNFIIERISKTTFTPAERSSNYQYIIKTKNNQIYDIISPQVIYGLELAKENDHCIGLIQYTKRLLLNDEVTLSLKNITLQVTDLNEVSKIILRVTDLNELPKIILEKP